MSPTSTDRQTFRQLVAEIAAKAKATLPEQVNGRIESAVKLVLSHDVTPQADGSIEVGSSSDPLKVYRLEGSSCTCQDFAYGQAPDGWCQHRIAAGIAKRVQQLLPVVPEVVEPSHAVETAPAPTRERAGMRLEAQVVIACRQVKLALWGPDDGDVQARLQAVLAQFPAPASPPAPTQGPDATPQCPQHGALRQGKRGWFCPTKLPDETWCQHKAT